MKNILKISILAILLVITATACSEDELMIYEGENNIYFTMKKWPSGYYGYTASLDWEGNTIKYTSDIIGSATDSIVVSYASGTVEHPFVLVPVNMMGQIADFDREIAFRITGSEGEEGTNFHTRTAYIPAGKNRGGILIEVPRPESPVRTVTIDLELIPNEYFQTNFPYVQRSTADTTKVSTTTFRVWVSSELTTPPMWMAAYYGTWSPSKIYVMVEKLGIPMSEIYSNMPQFTLMMPYGSLLKRYLIYNPTWDEDLDQWMDYGTNPSL